jgi:hypothetical protein
MPRDRQRVNLQDCLKLDLNRLARHGVVIKCCLATANCSVREMTSEPTPQSEWRRQRDNVRSKNSAFDKPNRYRPGI